MAFRAPTKLGAPPSDNFLVEVRVEGGVLEVAVEGDVNRTSVPVLLDEIRQAAGLFDVLEEAGNQPALPRRLRLDLTDSCPLETFALDEVLALIHELEADDVTVGIVRGS
jgi:hypothetical protein